MTAAVANERFEQAGTGRALALTLTWTAFLELNLSEASKKASSQASSTLLQM
jgi:hypothetical protein